MKKMELVKYECEYCHVLYDNEESCKKCEDSHKHIKSYKEIFEDKQTYPKLFVTTEDGEHVLYKKCF